MALLACSRGAVGEIQLFTRMVVYLLLRIGQTRVAPRRSGYVEIEFYDFYKLTSSIISNNQISRRGGIILDEMMMMISIHGSAIQNICTFR